MRCVRELTRNCKGVGVGGGGAQKGDWESLLAALVLCGRNFFTIMQVFRTSKKHNKVLTELIKFSFLLIK